MLEPIFDGVVDQKSGIETLRTINYKEWVSIEMKQPTSVELLKKSLQDVKEMIFVI